MSAPDRPALPSAARLALRKQQLLAESAALRALWVQDIVRLQQPLGWVDRAAVGVAWAARRPLWLIAGLAGIGGALVFAGPSRLRRWSGLAVGGWRLWQRYGGVVQAVLPGLLGRARPAETAPDGAVQTFPEARREG